MTQKNSRSYAGGGRFAGAALEVLPWGEIAGRLNELAQQKEKPR